MADSFCCSSVMVASSIQTTAAAKRGPQKHPRPASSIPTSIAASANASASASASAASAVASAKVAAYQNRVCRASKADEAQIESAYADNADSGYPLDGGGAMIGDAGDAGWGQGTEVTTRFDKMIQKILDIATKPNDFSTSSAASAFREFHSFCG